MSFPFLSLRHVKDYLCVKKFKYENLKTVSNILEKNNQIFTFDLKSRYHHIPIHKDFQKFLGFSWEFKGEKRFFEFIVLPFGLSSACYIFTKLMRKLVKKWRSAGIKCVMYLDDGIGAVITNNATKTKGTPWLKTIKKKIILGSRNSKTMHSRHSTLFGR